VQLEKQYANYSRQKPIKWWLMCEVLDLDDTLTSLFELYTILDRLVLRERLSMDACHGFSTAGCIGRQKADMFFRDETAAVTEEE
jgi:hypothetical protein